MEESNVARSHRKSTLILGFLVAVTILFSCGGQTEGDANEIIDSAAAAMAGVTSLHFRLDMGDAGVEFIPGMTATKMEGDAVRPDRMQATIQVVVGGIPLKVEYRAIGDSHYVTNPLDRQSWQALPGAAIAESLLDPGVGVMAILAELTDLELQGIDSIGGADSFRITGFAPSSTVAGFLDSPSAGGSTRVEIWIGADDSLVRKIVLHGPSLKGDPPDTLRTLELSRFNSSISIVAPF